MRQILTFNKIASEGLDVFPKGFYAISSDNGNPDAIMLRSHKLHDHPIQSNLKAIGRAGAGVNNIPLDKCTEQDIVVFNAPGANANAVKELVIAAMLLSARDIVGGIEFAKSLRNSSEDVHEIVEQNKSRFAGSELKGKTLGVIGLGAIGMMVANAGTSLGMKVLGYDPFLSVQNAWQLSSSVKPAGSIKQLLSVSDYISLHMPFTDKTKDFINKDNVSLLKSSATLLNFSRDGIVNEEDISEALDKNMLKMYITDFPSNILVDNEKALCIPHLGASTKQAEINCAVMVAEQIRDYLENGNITNSVNFPTCTLESSGKGRISIINDNIPNMVGQFTSVLAAENINILDLVNKSKNNIAYSIIECDAPVSPAVVEKLSSISGIRKVVSYI
jgi:D-3-phosphoglycerate dehydrogenase